MAHKILVVDDDPNALRLVSYALQAEGYIVAVASSGAEALSRLDSERPELVILDVMMPDMSGLEVCQRIRANPASARLPVLILSARGLVADRVSGLKSGADDYLYKPADTGELIARVEALLGRAAYIKAAPGPAAPAVQQRGRLLAFLGAKGGVGTTTVAVNVAAQLVEQGKKVTLVEMRPGAGSAATLLRLQPVRDLADLVGRPVEELSARDAVEPYIARHSTGIRLLAAPHIADSPCQFSAEFVEALTDALLEGVDYVIYDLAANWSVANQAVLRRTRFVAVLCEPDPISLPCAKATLATLQGWGVGGDLVGVVVVNHGTYPTPIQVPTVQATLGAGIIGVVPPAADMALLAAKEGTPLVKLQPQHAASMALKELANRLAQDRIRSM